MSGPPKFAKISLSLGRKDTKIATLPQKRKATTPSSTLLGDDHEDGVPEDGVAEDILEFGMNGTAVTQHTKERIIAGIQNGSWKDQIARRRQKSHLPGQTDPNEPSKTVKPPPEKQIKYGLNVVVKEERPVQETKTTEAATQIEQPPKELDEDERAIQALLGKGPATDAIIRPPSPPLTEEEAFNKSYKNAPPAPTLDGYNATPVEGFGAAILRGYLKPGQTLEDFSKKDKEKAAPKKRPGLLGLGAKESGLGIELGAWGKGDRRKGGAEEPATYVPVMMKNKKTGEVMTEREAKKLLDKEKDHDDRVTGSWKGETSRKLESREKRPREDNRDGNDRHRKQKRLDETVDRDRGPNSDLESKHNRSRHHGDRDREASERVTRDRASKDEYHKSRKRSEHDRDYERGSRDLRDPEDDKRDTGKRHASRYETSHRKVTSSRFENQDEERTGRHKRADRHERSRERDRGRDDYKSSRRRD